MEVARYVNVTYRDARYAVNRVSLLDAVCSNLGSSVSIDGQTSAIGASDYDSRGAVFVYNVHTLASLGLD